MSEGVGTTRRWNFCTIHAACNDSDCEAREDFLPAPHVAKLEAENASLRTSLSELVEALRWYADADHWLDGALQTWTISKNDAWSSGGQTWIEGPDTAPRVVIDLEEAVEVVSRLIRSLSVGCGWRESQARARALLHPEGSDE